MHKAILKNKLSALIVGIAVAIGIYLSQFTFAALICALVCIYGISISGLDLLFGYTGQISFGQAGFYGLGAYTSALLSLRVGLPPILTIFIGAVVAALFGISIAIPASKLVKHFLALLTIAFGQMIFLFLVNASKLTGGSNGIRKIPSISLFGYMLDTYQRMFFFSFALLIGILVLKNNIINSRSGRAFIAIRENTTAANGIGVNVRLYKVLAFAVSAFCSGLAGGLLAHLMHFINPDMFAATQSTLFMTMLLFGGMASLAGPIIGSIALLSVKEVVQVFADYQMLLYAGCILVVLFFCPNGIIGIYYTLRHWVKARMTKKERGTSVAGSGTDDD